MTNVLDMAAMSARACHRTWPCCHLSVTIGGKCLYYYYNRYYYYDIACINYIDMFKIDILSLY